MKSRQTTNLVRKSREDKSWRGAGSHYDCVLEPVSPSSILLQRHRHTRFYHVEDSAGNHARGHSFLSSSGPWVSCSSGRSLRMVDLPCCSPAVALAHNFKIPIDRGHAVHVMATSTLIETKTETVTVCGGACSLTYVATTVTVYGGCSSLVPSTTPKCTSHLALSSSTNITVPSSTGWLNHTSQALTTGTADPISGTAPTTTPSWLSPSYANSSHALSKPTTSVMITTATPWGTAPSSAFGLTTKPSTDVAPSGSLPSSVGWNSTGYFTSRLPLPTSGGAGSVSSAAPIETFPTIISEGPISTSSALYSIPTTTGTSTEDTDSAASTASSAINPGTSIVPEPDTTIVLTFTVTSASTTITIAYPTSLGPVSPTGSGSFGTILSTGTSTSTGTGSIGYPTSDMSSSYHPSLTYQTSSSI